MFDVYADIFNERGADYDSAIKQFPSARKNEFMEMFDGIDLSRINNILDIPSGGGYLKKFLDRKILITEVDPVKAFSQEKKHLSISEKFDIVYCLASLHHEADKSNFIEKMACFQKQSGYLCIGDVLKDSKEAIFLDNFVGNYNGMGHTGIYLENKQDILETLGGENYKIIRNQYQYCPWNFDSKKDMLLFFRKLFSLKNITNKELLDNINSYLGLTESKNNQIKVNFNLLYVTYQRTHYKT